MITKSNSSLITKKSIVRVSAAVALLLIALMLANYFSSEWNWGLEDFIFAAVMFSCTGLALELAFIKLKSTTQRAVVSITILAIFVLIWVQLAVGIFD